MVLIALCHLSATILFKLVDSYLIAFIFAQNVASIQKNRSDKSYCVIVALQAEKRNEYSFRDDRIPQKYRHSWKNSWEIDFLQVLTRAHKGCLQRTWIPSSRCKLWYE